MLMICSLKDVLKESFVDLLLCFEGFMLIYIVFLLRFAMIGSLFISIILFIEIEK